jgi:hypothetical protein
LKHQLLGAGLEPQSVLGWFTGSGIETYRARNKGLSGSESNCALESRGATEDLPACSTEEGSSRIDKDS